jgi:hypothetical protein
MLVAVSNPAGLTNKINHLLAPRNWKFSSALPATAAVGTCRDSGVDFMADTREQRII